MNVQNEFTFQVYYGLSYAQDLRIGPYQELTVYQVYRHPGEYFIQISLAP